VLLDKEAHRTLSLLPVEFRLQASYGWYVF